MSSSVEQGAVIVLTTVGAGGEAATLARTLVEERLAACVNVLPPMTSVYRWQDAVEQATEHQLVIKTDASRVTALEARIRQLHPYEVPEFLVLPVSGGSDAYLDWLRAAVLMAFLALVPSAWAQTSLPPDVFHTGPACAFEFTSGWAGFLDESVIAHLVLGGSGRMQLGSRVSVGPELVYMRGPGDDRDLFLTGNLTFDFVPQSPGFPPRVSPFVTVGAGWFRHSDRFGPQAFASNEGAVTAGGGVRVMISERAYAAVEARLGWEPHARVTANVGLLLR